MDKKLVEICNIVSSLLMTELITHFLKTKHPSVGFDIDKILNLVKLQWLQSNTRFSQDCRTVHVFFG